MPKSPESFEIRVRQLKTDMVDQVRRVRAVLEDAVEAVFDRDAARADRLIEFDDEVDRVDVAIEQAAVRLLSDATSQGAGLTDEQLREILTIVKVNNEAERIADSATAMAEHVATLSKLPEGLPETFRVLVNSVIGIVRDTTRCYDEMNPRLAKVVLASEDTVEAFKSALVRESEQQLALGAISTDLAFILHEFAGQCAAIADHASNIAEQVIYVATGTIVRHTDAGWVERPSA